MYRLRTDFEDIQRKEEETHNGALKVTSKMIRTIFVEIKRNIPFSSHSSLVALQEINGIDMGYHHYEQTSAIRITESMSAFMHKSLIYHMLSENLPFSMIIDGSTDSTESHYLIIYFQILEHNVPVVCFYRLVETTSDLTAKGLFKSITDAMKSEEVDFYKYFRNNLVGYISDGERVMTGKEGGVISFIRQDVKNPIYAVHCMAHRIHLAIEKAYKTIPYFKSFDKFINKIFQFYNWHANKRKAHLRETAQNCNLKMYELNYIYRTRWISSELQSLTNLKKVWILLTKDLHLISINNQFDKESRDRARNLVLSLRGKNFLAILNFVFDVLEHLSYWSKKMQERAALLVDFVDFKDKIINTFETLKTENGRELNVFLENALCDGEKCQTLQYYYLAETVTYFDVSLRNDRNDDEIDVPYIDEIRSNFLDTIKFSVKSYFPDSDLNLFKIFRPNKIPAQESASLSYGVREILNLCQIFMWNECDDFLTDWAKLVESIIESEDFCTFRDKNTETFAFWSIFLNKQGIAWTEKTKKMIQTILVIPIGSADAERGFSIMNHIKYDRRSRLSGKHLEDIMRIRINGNDDIEKFPAMKYARQWIKENHMRTDDPRQQRKPKNSLNEEAEEKKYLPKLSFL